MNKIIIAIDGHSSCGKSTMAKQLAQQLNYIYVDTGAMYRCVTLYAINNGMFSGKSLDSDALEQRIGEVKISFTRDEAGQLCAMLNGKNVEKEIRGMSVSERVSMVAKQPFVRKMLVEQQQRMGQDKGIVMDGRDIGTTVFPDAELKIFVTASAEVRAERRYKELLDKGENANYEDILANVKERDYMDSHRAVSPLRMADDAVLLDNSYMTIEEQNQWLLAKVNETLSKDCPDD
ncbi:(d)CMP kinase [Prevotella sp. P2-180]|uniref:(d)CMP kinase n=1 Tax=Prevotella sp. P2-180 TaxID=2024224 RepID=UPI000B9647BD|nr:(d)CMP kinase [Prevotella sp. P2-180]OYP68156.1 cytidylate kinase [Prevotella sp. P2-180]